MICEHAYIFKNGVTVCLLGAMHSRAVLKYSANHAQSGSKYISFHGIAHYRAGGKGTAGTAMAVPVFEGEKMASLGF